ncbi:Uncharacterised protein [Legionella busanensis]|uniref:Uncharacterized protein n=1 Tax=Legionella busanensis TaxID=190655 RepID=A0A378JNM8_9GAMM|nr:hypothetical protein [Legionella busanensis]STX52855.1 Uncharacterised protein [Legionella busanensis]
MLLNDNDKYPLSALLEQIYDQIQQEDLPIDPLLHQAFNNFLLEYQALQKTLTYIKVTNMEPLTAREQELAYSIYNADFLQPYLDAKNHFERQSPTIASKDLCDQYTQYLETDRKKRISVFNEINQLKSVIACGEYLGKNGFFSITIS